MDGTASAPWQQMWEQMQQHLSFSTNENKKKQPHIHSYNPSKRRHLLHHAAKQMGHSNHSYFSTTTTSKNDSIVRIDKADALFELIPMHSHLAELRDFVRNMFHHAYDSYMQRGFPHEIKPITCGQGDFSLVQIPALTLIDTLDTLLILENTTEFARSTERLRGMQFRLDVNVSVFETNIRILGGLLSAHQLAIMYFESHDPPSVESVWDTSTGDILNTYDYDIKSQSNGTDWEYDGILLDLALDLGERLLPAFRTSTGIPYGTINLQYGVPAGETPVASLAGAGTLLLEMELLSRYSHDERFGQSARLAAKALFLRRSTTRGLFGKHIDVQSAAWTETLSGIGSNSDSYLEYLAKMYFLFPEEEDFWFLFQFAYSAVYNESRVGEWYADSDMNYGKGKRTVFESLAAFYPDCKSPWESMYQPQRVSIPISWCGSIWGFSPNDSIT